MVKFASVNSHLYYGADLVGHTLFGSKQKKTFTIECSEYFIMRRNISADTHCSLKVKTFENVNIDSSKSTFGI